MTSRSKKEAWELVRSPELEALMRDPMFDLSQPEFCLLYKGEQVWPRKPVPSPWPEPGERVEPWFNRMEEDK